MFEDITILLLYSLNIHSYAGKKEYKNYFTNVMRYDTNTNNENYTEDIGNAK